MAKLHEVLAVEGDLEKTARAILDEASVTFTKKPDHFLGQMRSLIMFDAERAVENMKEEKALVTTVRDKLVYVFSHLSRLYDTTSRKECTNQAARADIVVDGETLVAQVPATLLLSMESRLRAVKELCEQIPTLEPGKPWALDPVRGDGIYVTTAPEVRFRAEKAKRHQVIVPPTEQHPAQVEVWDENVNVGKYETTHWSGAYSPADKSALLARIDKLIRAVKKARQRANNTEVISKPIGDAIFNYLMR